MIRSCSPGCDEHYGCRLRDKGVQVHPQATPSRHNNVRPKGMKPPGHWGDVMYDERPNGTKMPILNSDASPVRRKQAQEQSHRMDELKRIQHAQAT